MENDNVLHSSSQVFEQKFVVIDEEKYLTSSLRVEEKIKLTNAHFLARLYIVLETSKLFLKQSNILS